MTAPHKNGHDVKLDSEQGGQARGADLEAGVRIEAKGFVARSVQRSRDAATGLAHTALQRSGEAYEDAKDAVGHAASSLMERTHDMARKTGRAASHTATRASGGIGRLAREQPLLVAGVGFALGVALGALIPLSRMENDMLGEQADKLKESAKDLASEGYEKVKSVAQRSYEAAAETLKSVAEEHGMSSTTGDPPASAENAATKAVGNDGGNTGTTSYRH